MPHLTFDLLVWLALITFKTCSPLTWCQFEHCGGCWGSFQCKVPDFFSFLLETWSASCRLATSTASKKRALAGRIESLFSVNTALVQSCFTLRTSPQTDTIWAAAANHLWLRSLTSHGLQHQIPIMGCSFGEMFSVEIQWNYLWIMHWYHISGVLTGRIGSLFPTNTASVQSQFGLGDLWEPEQ